MSRNINTKSSKAGEEVYLKNLYFKSYATYFYGETQPPEKPNFYDTDWLLTGDIDKDVYFVTKIHRAHRLEEYDDIKEIGRKNGFVFYLRAADYCHVSHNLKTRCCL